LTILGFDFASYYKIYKLLKLHTLRVTSLSYILHQSNMQSIRATYYIRVTSQASYSPEYITPTQKNHYYLICTKFSQYIDQTIFSIGNPYALIKCAKPFHISTQNSTAWFTPAVEI
jgi:hypothetical protein